MDPMADDLRNHVSFRVACPADSSAVTATLAEAFVDYRAWAPPDWSPPQFGPQEETRLAEALARPGVWCLLAEVGPGPAGHVALSPFTAVQPDPPPNGTIN